ncbi:MAG TPA: endonuclease/exonuclease/phosphatase family protein [Daejeonella sp.]|nr:endonuclease/exonuclease/phosphatase family protein [Daejeonella sp.]
MEVALICLFFKWRQGIMLVLLKISGMRTFDGKSNFNNIIAVMLRAILSHMKYFLPLLILLLSTVAMAQPKAPASLKVMSYNIHHANPPSKPGFIDLDAIARVIRREKPHLVALQEVDVNTGRSGRLNQAAELARKLRMNFVFAKAIDYDGGEYGLAILSKYPLSETVIHQLPTDSASKGEPRILLTGKINLPGGREIRFGNTHLDSETDSLNRHMQINEINRISQKETLPFILAGDLNADPGTGVIRTLDSQFKRTCEPCQFTYPAVNPQKAIDFIAVKSRTRMQIISHRVLNESYASDHLPIAAVLKLH